MLKKIDILGMEIDNYTVREAIMQVEIYLNNNVMNTIETIHMKMLDVAVEEKSVKECIGQLDLAVIGEKEILIAAGIHSSQRIRETIEHEFFQEFMKRIIRNKKTVFLLGADKESVDELKEFLEEEYERLQIVGSCALEEKAGDVESVVNEMNGVSPAIIFSVLPSPEQEIFLLENKGKLDAKIWYGLGEGYREQSGIRHLSKLASRLIHRKKLQNRLHRYNNELSETNELEEQNDHSE